MIEYTGEIKCCEKLFIEHIEPDYHFLFGMASESHGYWIDICPDPVPEVPIPEVPIPAAFPLLLIGTLAFLSLGMRRRRR